MLTRRSFLGALAGLPVLGHVLQRAPLPSDTPLVVNEWTPAMLTDWTHTTTQGDMDVDMQFTSTWSGSLGETRNFRWGVDALNVTETDIRQTFIGYHTRLDG